MNNSLIRFNSLKSSFAGRIGFYSRYIVLCFVIIAAIAVVIGGKGSQIWEKLPKFDTGQVAGEKTTESEATESANAIVTSSPEATPKPSPEISPTSTPSPTPKLTFGDLQTAADNSNASAEKNKAEAANKPAEPPGQFDYYGDKRENLKVLEPSQQFNLTQGSVKFNFTYDGGYKSRMLFLGNFNGVDWKNVLAIVFAGCTVGFDTYDNLEQEGEDNPNIELGEDCQGKSFDLEFSWDFASALVVKRIYVDGNLKRESFPKVVPTEANLQILIGPIADLEITGR